MPHFEVTDSEESRVEVSHRRTLSARFAGVRKGDIASLVLCVYIVLGTGPRAVYPPTDSRLAEAMEVRKKVFQRVLRLDRQVQFLNVSVHGDAVCILEEVQRDVARLQEGLRPEWIDDSAESGLFLDPTVWLDPTLRAYLDPFKSSLALAYEVEGMRSLAVSSAYCVQDGLRHLSALVDQPQSKETVASLREIAAAAASRLDTLAIDGPSRSPVAALSGP
jgi:hypothetical protein